MGSCTCEVQSYLVIISTVCLQEWPRGNKVASVCIISLLSIGDDILDKEPEIFDIRNCLADYKHKWRSIGEGLRVRHGDLKSIQNNTPDDDERLAEMLRTWKDSCCSPYTWRNIINVLKARAVNLQRAAEDIHSSLLEGGDLYEIYYA